MRNSDYAEIANLVQKTLEPLISNIRDINNKVDRLGEKVDELAQDRVTRSDMEKLRAEMQTMFVPRDAYEPRHAALIARDTDLENRLKQMDADMQIELQRLHERLESGKQQIEDRFKAQLTTELDTKDRAWIRVNQIFGIAAIVISLLALIFQHVRFQ